MHVLSTLSAPDPELPALGLTHWQREGDHCLQSLQTCLWSLPCCGPIRKPHGALASAGSPIAHGRVMAALLQAVQLLLMLLQFPLQHILGRLTLSL